MSVFLNRHSFLFPLSQQSVISPLADRIAVHQPACLQHPPTRALAARETFEGTFSLHGLALLRATLCRTASSALPFSSRPPSVVLGTIASSHWEGTCFGCHILLSGNEMDMSRGVPQNLHPWMGAWEEAERKDLKQSGQGHG